VIDANRHKYSVSALCKALNISRQSYYYKAKEKADESDLEAEIENSFRKSRNNYGTRKIKKDILSKGFKVSRRKIGRIMEAKGLVSNYTVKCFKVHKNEVNEAKLENTLDREFQNRAPLEAIVTDLTYVKVGCSWHYICMIIDLFNREIIGHSCGARKDAALVKQAFSAISYPLVDVNIFHTDRGKEFDNKVIDELLEAFKISRSLSRKGNPYDNSVAESTYKSTKVEFVHQNTFANLKELKLQLFDYVNWWNNHRLHGTLDYVTPAEYRRHYNFQNRKKEEQGKMAA